MRRALLVCAIVASACAGEPDAPASPQRIHEPSPHDLSLALAALRDTDAVPPDDAPPRDGTWTVHHRSGAIAAQGPMVAGRRHGAWERFDAEGRRLEQGEYEHDRPVGTWCTWARDGSERPPIEVDASACAAPPPVDDWIMGCALQPRPPGYAHERGAGELRRCVAHARPWIDLALASGDHEHRPFASALRRAESPELQRVVLDALRDALVRWRAAGWPEGSHEHFLVVAAVRILDGDRRLGEVVIATLPHGGLELHQAGARIATTRPGFAARWYEAVVAALPASRGDDRWAITNTLLGAARTIASARPDLAIAVWTDAIARLESAGERAPEARQERAVLRLAAGDAEAARRDADAARAEYEARGCERCLRELDGLRARIADAQGDRAGAAEARASADERARIEDLERSVETANRNGVEHLEGGRFREAVAALEPMIPGADALPPPPVGRSPWGAALRFNAGRARLGLGELGPARALLAGAMERTEPATHAPYLRTLAEIELAAGDLDAAERHAVEALARDRALHPTPTTFTPELEETLERVRRAR